MREIKFRGMTGNGYFVYGDLYRDVPNETLYYKEYSQRICWKVGTSHHNQPVKNGTVGQFTGRLDKEKREIYEWDIVKIPEHYIGDNLCPSHIAVITYNAPEFQTEPYFDESWNDIEVIGNLHENPELLEGWHEQ